MPNPKSLTVFISSPSDVEPERVVAERVVRRLDRIFSAHASIRAFRWEREPLRATGSFQQDIPSASKVDIVILILWARLGTPLGDDSRGAISGEVVTGTEFEFEDAVKAFRDQGRPDVLVYQKQGVPPFEEREKVKRYLIESAQVDEFFNTWFKGDDGGPLARRTFKTTADFEEMLDQHLSELIKRHLGPSRVGELHRRIDWSEGSPFRGLEAFEVKHAPIFFGRTRARHELREVLTRQLADGHPWVLLLGASGSGKSSLVRAGLIPDLITPGMVDRVGLCRFAIMRPSDQGGDLIAALASALLTETALPELLSLSYDSARLEKLLLAGSHQASLPVEQGLARAGESVGLMAHAVARLALVIDQLEEIFLADPHRSRLPQFLSALDALAGSGRVWIVATLRSDFLRDLEASRELAERFNGNARSFLPPPSEPELRQIITRPAEVAGLSFAVDPDTDVSLDEAIAAAARVAPESLPLLEYLLDQLWQRRGEHGELTWEAYTVLGGLEGAIGSRAEAVFKSLPADARDALPKLLRALVTIAAPEDDARPTALWARKDRFPERSPTRALVDAMLDREARLLVADEGGRVRVAHEALLSHWERATKQIRADTTDLKVWARLRAQTKRWMAEAAQDRPSLLLSRGLPLSEAEDLLARRADEIDEDLVEYINASRAARENELEEDRRQQATLRDALRMTAVRQVRDDPAMRAALLREFEDPGRAHGWLAAAVETARGLAWHATLPPSSDDHYDQLALSRDGRVLVARRIGSGNDTSVIVWRVGWIGEPGQWGVMAATVSDKGYVEPLSRGAQSPRSYRVVPGYLWLGLEAEDRLITLSADTTRRVDRIEVKSDLRDEGRLDTVEENDEGTSTVRQRIQLAEVRRVPPAGPVAPAKAVRHSPGNRHLASLHEDGTLFVWRFATDSPPERLGTFPTTEARVRLRVGPDGQSVVLHDAQSRSATLLLRSGDDLSVRLLGNDVSAVEFSDDGAWVVTARGNSRVRVQSTADPAIRIELHAEGPPVTAAAFAPDGTAVLTGDAEGTIRIWPFNPDAPHSMRAQSAWAAETVPLGGGFTRYEHRMPADQPTTRKRHAAAIRRIAMSPDGRRVVTIAEDGTAVLAGLGAPYGYPLHTAAHRVSDAAFSADGRWVATTAGEASPRVWKSDRIMEPVALSPPPWIHGYVHRLSVEATAEGEVVWTGFSDGEIRRSRADGPGPMESFSIKGDLRLRSSMRSHVDPDLRWRCDQMEGEEARLFPIKSGRPPFILHGVAEDITVAVSPDEQYIVGITDKGAAFVWRAGDADACQTLRHGRSKMSVAAFSADGRWLATGTRSGTVLVWKGDATGKPIRLASLDEAVDRLTFSADAEWLLAEGAGGRTIVASTSGGKVRDLRWTVGARFIDGRLPVLAVSSDRVAEVPEDGHPTARRVFLQRLDRLQLISPNGKWVLAGQREALVLWSAVGELEPVPLSPVGTPVTATAATPDGNRLLTGHQDGTVRIWSVDSDPRSLIEKLWRATPYCLSIEERQTLLAEDLATARKRRKSALDVAYGYHAESLRAKAP